MMRIQLSIICSSLKSEMCIFFRFLIKKLFWVRWLLLGPTLFRLLVGLRKQLKLLLLNLN